MLAYAYIINLTVGWVNEPGFNVPIFDAGICLHH